MSIEYTYEIVSVDAQARCMEVIYRAEGHPEQRIGTRLPYEGEALEAVISAYSPVGYWESLQAAVTLPSVGAQGVITPPTPTSEQELANHKMWEQVQFEKRVAKALVKFGVLQSDPTEIAVSQL